jgi:nitrile hydratase accessory protein
MPKTFEQLASLRKLPDEVVFNEPWEAHAFALALALFESGRFEWEEFRQRLIAEIAAADEAERGSGSAATYYECWLAALEKLLVARKIAQIEEIDRRAELIAANPPAPTRALTRGPVKVA